MVRRLLMRLNFAEAGCDSNDKWRRKCCEAPWVLLSNLFRLLAGSADALIFFSSPEEPLIIGGRRQLSGNNTAKAWRLLPYRIGKSTTSSAESAAAISGDVHHRQSA